LSGSGVGWRLPRTRKAAAMAQDSTKSIGTYLIIIGISYCFSCFIATPAFGQTCPTTGAKSAIGDWGSVIGPFFGPPAVDDPAQSFPMHAILLKTGKVLV